MYKIRPLSLVKLVDDVLPIYKDHPISKEKTLIYLGEIPNMPGHGIFLGDAGQKYIGYHTDSFRELTSEEV